MRYINTNNGLLIFFPSSFTLHSAIFDGGEHENHFNVTPSMEIIENITLNARI